MPHFLPVCREQFRSVGAGEISFHAGLKHKPFLQKESNWDNGVAKDDRS
jgi:hypothetical protein